jgi:hypothetical protein
VVVSGGGEFSAGLKSDPSIVACYS